MPGRTVRILLLEDNPTDAIFLREALSETRLVAFRTTRVERLEEALRALGKESFDVVLADLGLPDSQGIETFERLHATVPTLPIIILTALAEEAIAIQAVKSGAQDYLVKGHINVLGRVILYAIERMQSQERIRLLSEASVLLASTIDYETTLGNVAKLAVPRLGDWCAVHLLHEDGSVRHVGMAHTDPGKLENLRDMLSRFPSPPEAPHGYAKVLRTGKPELLQEVTDEMLRESSQDTEHLSLLRSLGLRSAMCAPLVVAGEMLGALSVASSESHRRFGSDELTFLEEVARRAALAISNSRLYKAMHAAVRAREEFLSVASHELKTPLTVLKLEMENILRTIRKGRQGALETVLGLAETGLAEGRKLERLVDELLDVSRLTSGRLALAPEQIDLSHLAREVTARFGKTQTADAPRIRLKAETGVVGRWDRLRLEQVIWNLLSNAVKYGKGEPVELEVSSGGEKGVLTVRDQGIGMTPGFLNRLFQPFERDSSAAGSDGLGVGLYIARRIVEAHGGQIRAETRQGKGSRFTVELPRIPQVSSALQASRGLGS